MAHTSWKTSKNSVYHKRKFRFVFDIESSPCSNYERGWMGRCKVDRSYRNNDCKEDCPRYKPTFKSRLKLAWKVLCWTCNFRRV